jgi:hypothetical protein
VIILNGTFTITLLTPIGPQNGILTFADERGILSGSIRAMGVTNPFRNGKINGNSFEFSGTLNAGFINLRYNAKGTIVGNTLKAVVTTNSGTFQISGTRKA